MNPNYHRIEYDDDMIAYYEQQRAEEEYRNSIISEHTDEIIDEFRSERLSSYYLKYPTVILPAFKSLNKGKSLYEIGHYSAAFVFFISAIEIFLKAGIIKPVVYGLVHNENLADIILDMTAGQTGVIRYKKLLKKLISTFTNEDTEKDFDLFFGKFGTMQDRRNDIIHKGDDCSEKDAEDAGKIANEAFTSIVKPMLEALNLTTDESGLIKL